jgi:hypothetical protein
MKIIITERQPDGKSIITITSNWSLKKRVKNSFGETSNST